VGVHGIQGAERGRRKVAYITITVTKEKQEGGGNTCKGNHQGGSTPEGPQERRQHRTGGPRYHLFWVGKAHGKRTDRIPRGKEHAQERGGRDIQFMLGKKKNKKNPSHAHETAFGDKTKGRKEKKAVSRFHVKGKKVWKRGGVVGQHGEPGATQKKISKLWSKKGFNQGGDTIKR